ncbi:MAG: hypothetical protein J1E39_05395 [Eubacterium sp.]|nr:hypothetical protein [Eubacterium sp.]
MKKLYLYELKKLCDVIAILTFIALMGVKLLDIIHYTPEYDFSVEYYREYIDIVYGEANDEKGEYIENERQYIEDTISRKDEMEQAFSSGKITLDEFNEYYKEYNYALSHFGAMMHLYEKYQYFETMKGTERTPVYFYDLDAIEYLKEFGADALFLIFIIVFGLRAWNLDRQHGMLLSVSATKFGRLRKENMQLAALSSVAVVGSVISFSLDIIIFCARCGSEQLSMPLYSMQEFGGCQYNVSILDYMLLVLLIRLIWSVALSFIIAAVYKLIGNMYACIAVSAGVIFIPLATGEVLPQWLRTALAGSQLTGFSVLESSVPLSIPTAAATAAAMYGIIILITKKKRV